MLLGHITLEIGKLMSNKNLTSKSYEFKVSVEKRKVSIKTPLSEQAGKGSYYQSDVIILIPDVAATEFTRFILAYYPEYPNELPLSDHKFIGLLAFPIANHTRLAFDCQSKICTELHFIVMSEEVEVELMAHMIGKTIALCIEPDTYDLDNGIDI